MRTSEANMALTRRDLLVRGGRLAGAVSLAPALALAPEAARARLDPRLRELRRAVRGPVLTPGDPLYEKARQPFNARFAAILPLAVVQPLTAADVRQVVLWSARTGVSLAARAGGHSYGGYSTTRGVVVDLSRLGGVSVGATGLATVGAGVRLFDVTSALARRGLALPTGTCPTVGLAGLALGGGFGLASRAWGLTCDNVVALQIVTASGRILSCDRRRNPDLFWACRGGGGGNFGIVTRFVLRTHSVQAGSYFIGTWPSEALEALVARFQQWAFEAPDELSSICRIASTTAGPSVQVFGQHLGPEAALRRLLPELTRDNPPRRLTVGSSSWLDLQRRWAGCLGESTQECLAFEPQSFAAASDYARQRLSADAVATIRRFIEERQGASGAVLLDSYGGAVNRVPPAATAFVHRNALLSLQYFTSWAGAGSGANNLSWLRRFHAAMRPFVSGFAYQNYVDPALSNWKRAYYGANLARLVAVKRRYDPDNLFRFRQSIPTRL